MKARASVPLTNRQPTGSSWRPTSPATTPPDGPNFAPRAVDLGVRAIISVSLSVDPERRSSLNLYSATAGSFDEEAQLTAGLFGLQAAGLLFGADQVAGLDRALQSRDVIGQAKGILMERYDVNNDDAFQLLVGASQNTNTKLIEVARSLAGEKGRRIADTAH